MWYLEWAEVMAIISLACTVTWLSNRVWLLENNSRIWKCKDIEFPKNYKANNLRHIENEKGNYEKT